MAAIFKQQAHTLIEQLPDTATWDDLIERARFHKAVDGDEFASDEDVRRVFSKWDVDVDA